MFLGNFESGTYERIWNTIRKVLEIILHKKKKKNLMDFFEWTENRIGVSTNREIRG